MLISEIFTSIQGEGRYQGIPTLFIRTSGCTRHCEFCDTPYHKYSEDVNLDLIVKTILKKKVKTIVWTGGEPLLNLSEIAYVIDKTKKEKFHHLESNGDLIRSEERLRDLMVLFSYVVVSPKELTIAKRIHFFSQQLKLSSSHYFDIKIVTDLEKINFDILKYATMLMPLTTEDEEKNKIIRKKVWDYCVINNLFFSSRLHIDVWGRIRKK